MAAKYVPAQARGPRGIWHQLQSERNRHHGKCLREPAQCNPGKLHCPYPFNTNPSCAGNGILYETANDIHSIFGYAPNLNTITAFGSNNLPTGRIAISVTGFPANPSTISNRHYSWICSMSCRLTRYFP